jgi:hypothetical protein
VTAPSLDALVASTHWEYAPSVVVRGSAVDGLGIIIAIRPLRDDESPPTMVIEAIDSKGWRGFVSPGYIRPDLEHPGNYGHLLALVRKAYTGCRVEIMVFEDGSSTVTVIDAARPDDDLDFPEDTLGLALAAALLAAPAKAGEP